jgi:hypothetical protein
MTTKTYSANEVTCLVGLINIDSGRGDDTFIKISQKTKRFSSKAGIDGEVTRSESKDDTHVVEITLMQSSDGNAVLSAMHLIDRATRQGIVPIMIKDRQGNSVFGSLEAWITGWPDREYKKEVDTVTWEFEVANPDRFEGGN